MVKNKYITENLTMVGIPSEKKQNTALVSNL